MSSPSPKNPAFLRQSDLLQFLPFSAATLWRAVRAGTFPAPVKLSARVTAWRTSDIDEWMDSRGPEPNSLNEAEGGE